MVTKRVYINGLSIIAPGMAEPANAFAILRGEEQWQVAPLPKLVPDLLPANERRRTTPLIKLALKTIQTLLHKDDDLSYTSTVFASSDGDLGIVDKICQSLTLPEKAISPTQFHNSVHNAAAGYWAIAASMSSASVSLSAGNETFSAGLIEAVTQVVTEQHNVFLVAYDVVAPEPLDAKRHFEYSIGIALRLGIKSEAGNIGNIDISIDRNKINHKTVTSCQNYSLESLRTGNPVGAGLPLLESLMRQEKKQIVIPYIMNQQLLIEVNQ